MNDHIDGKRPVVAVLYTVAPALPFEGRVITRPFVLKAGLLFGYRLKANDGWRRGRLRSGVMRISIYAARHEWFLE